MSSDTHYEETVRTVFPREKGPRIDYSRHLVTSRKPGWGRAAQKKYMFRNYRRHVTPVVDR